MCAADGFAVGAAVATGQVTVQVIVFLAVILHKVSFPDRTLHWRIDGVPDNV